MQENNTQIEKLVGIEVGHTDVIAVCIGQDGGIIDSFKRDFRPPENTLQKLAEIINQAKTKFGDFSNLGIAVPGLLNRQTSQVAYSPSHPEFADTDILTELEEQTGLKLYIKNDANAAAYAEHLFGAGRGSENMFYVTLGEGIGGALILNDQIWHGASGFAGEFGFVAINSEGMRLEDVASAKNIVRRTRDWFHKDTTSSLNEIGEDNITIEDIVREAINEDDFAQLMLERTGTYIGTAIAGVINLLNIERIVVGGEIMKAEEIVLEAIVHRAKELSFYPSFEATEIVAGTLGENAGAIGAAYLSNKA